MLRNKKRSQQIMENKGFSLYQLGDISQNVTELCQQTHRLKQQIKSTYGKVNKNISQSIIKIQNEGAYFASKLQEQREGLTSLVSHYQKSIYEEKINRYKDIRNKKQVDENQVNINKLKFLQKQYDNIVVKTNSSSYQVCKKMDQVRMLRSQRAIFNGLFDQIQRQLFSLQLSYKQMVIERSFLQNKYKQKTQQFEYIQHKTQQQKQKQLKRIMKIRKNMEEHNCINQENVKNKRININSLKQSNQLPNNRVIKALRKTQRRFENQGYEKCKNMIQIQRVQYEKKVKQILYNLQVKDINQIPRSLTQIQNKIDYLYQDGNFLYQKIYQKKYNLNKIQKYKPRIENKKQVQKVNKLKKSHNRLDINKSKIQKQLKTFQNYLNALKIDLNLGNKDDQIEDSVNIIDKYIVQLFPKINTFTCSQQYKNKQKQQKLNIILNNNKTTKTTARTYTEKDLIAISKLNLNFNLREDIILNTQNYE